MICTSKVWKTEATFNETYNWLLLVNKLWSAHIRSGKRKPLFNETFNWLLLVNKLWPAHIRSGKRKPLFNETFFNSLLLNNWLLHRRYKHIWSRKQKPLFNEAYNWLLLVTSLWYAHIRSGNGSHFLMKPKTGYYWLLHCDLHT
jgi:hypothetical protein